MQALSFKQRKACFQKFNRVNMETKTERIASEWVKKHPNATLKGAFVAGYFRSTDAWVNHER